MTDSISILIKHYFLWKCLYQKWKAKILLKAQIIPCPFLWMRNNSDRRHVCFLFLLLQILPFPLNIRYGRVRTLFCVTLATKQLKKKTFLRTIINYLVAINEDETTLPLIFVNETYLEMGWNLKKTYGWTTIAPLGPLF